MGNPAHGARARRARCRRGHRRRARPQRSPGHRSCGAEVVRDEVDLGPDPRSVRRRAVHLRDAGDERGLAGPRASHLHRIGAVPHRNGAARRPLDRIVSHRAARGHSQRRLRALGVVRARAPPAEAGGAVSREHARVPSPVPGRAHRARISRRRRDPRDHDPAHHHLDQHRGAADRPRPAARGCAGAGRNAVGSDPDRGASLCASRNRRRHHARAGARARRDDGRHDGHRELADDPRLVVRAGILAAGRDRQRVRGGERRDAYRRSRRSRPSPLRRHRAAQHRRARPGADVAARPGSGAGMMLAKRRAVNLIMTGVCGLALAVALVPLVSLLWLVISHGFRGLSFDFFTAVPAPVGEAGGGVGTPVAGRLYSVGIACLIGVPLGVGAGVFLAERGDGRVGDAIRFTAEVLSGVPSIVVGIVAYGLVVLPMRRFSALAGGVALAVLMVPTLARSTEELVRSVPRSLREASLALGVREWRTSLRVVLRTALGGIVTAVLLAVARAAGETAPLLFTSLNNQYWNWRADQPTASLTVQIFNYAVSPYEDWHDKAWSASLVLLLLIGVLSLAARLLARNRFGGAR